MAENIKQFAGITSLTGDNESYVEQLNTLGLFAPHQDRMTTTNSDRVFVNRAPGLPAFEAVGRWGTREEAEAPREPRAQERSGSSSRAAVEYDHSRSGIPHSEFT
jgi:hypothetical protein